MRPALEKPIVAGRQIGPGRRLTDEDITAIVNELEVRVVSRFYGNIGRGVWGIVWRGFVVVIVVIAAYGSARGANS